MKPNYFSTLKLPSKLPKAPKSNIKLINKIMRIEISFLTKSYNNDYVEKVKRICVLSERNVQSKCIVMTNKFRAA